MNFTFGFIFNTYFGFKSFNLSVCETNNILFSTKYTNERWDLLSVFLLSVCSAEPVGLDWNKLQETLNPTFDFEAAVQTVLETDDSLEEV